MSAFWSYFWPPFAAGIGIGLIAGLVGFRLKVVRMRGKEPTFVRPPPRQRLLALAAGSAIAIVLALLWHGPLGAADRLSIQVERIARQVLVDYEAPNGVTVHIHHGPLTRQLILSGPSNDFQRAETARLLSQIPGVSYATWAESAGVPLIVEGAAVALLGFLSGLVLAYLAELRRRYNAQWNW